MGRFCSPLRGLTNSIGPFGGSEKGGNEMIILDENKLSYTTLVRLANDYHYEENELDDFIEKHLFDGEALVDKIVDVIEHGLRVVDIFKNNWYNIVWINIIGG